MQSLLSVNPHNMFARRWIVQASALMTVGILSLAPGCADEQTPTPLPERLQKLESDLTLGSQGEQVQALHDYLRQFGYFPNDELARKYPAWRPFVSEAPLDSIVFDDRTRQAVLQLQGLGSLPATGIVDEATRKLIKAPRCGNPDGMPHPLSDGTDKFAFGCNSNTLLCVWPSGPNAPPNPYKRLNANGLPTSLLDGEVAAAFQAWANEADISFVSSQTSPLINIMFASIDGPGGILGSSPIGGTNGQTIQMDASETWGLTSRPTAGQVDFRTVLMHEIGHFLGLEHSSIPQTTMFPFLPQIDQSLALDDKVGFFAKYHNFTAMTGSLAPPSGKALDVGVGADGSVWIVGSNQLVYRWTGSAWIATGAVASRIAVDQNGAPWIVSPNGSIWRHTTNNPNTGSWQSMPGLAKDIGIGNNGNVWVAGTNSGIWKWNGTGWDPEPQAAGVTRIAVGPAGNPWIVNTSGSVWRKESNSVSSGSWTLLTGIKQTDVGISVGNYAWAVHSGDGISVLQEQAFLADGVVPGSGAPARSGFTYLQNDPVGGSKSISVGPNGKPWLVNSGGTLFRPRE